MHVVDLGALCLVVFLQRLELFLPFVYESLVAATGSASLAGLLLGGVSLTAFAAEVPSGILCDRVGATSMLVLACAASLADLLLLDVSLRLSTPFLLLFYSLCAGLSSAFLSGTAETLAAHDRTRGRVSIRQSLSLINLAGDLGDIFAPLIAAALLAWTSPLSGTTSTAHESTALSRGPYLVHMSIVPTGLSLILALILRRRTPTSAAHASSPLSLRAMWDRRAQDSHLWRLCMVTAFFAAVGEVFYLYSTLFLPLFGLQRDALVAGVVAVSMVSAISGILVDSLVPASVPAQRVLVIACATGLVAFVVGPIAHTVFGLRCVALAAGVTMAASWGVFSVTSVEALLSESQRRIGVHSASTVLAVSATLRQLGMGILAMAVGVLVDVTGDDTWAPLPLLVAVCVIARLAVRLKS